ncbi:MAG: HAMP domain-containing histidine kinase [Clostridia bacterium]|nr:HAMP domain-containing histidine kinase [Clostridia bacterium]
MKNGTLRSESDRTAAVIILICMTIVVIGCILGMSYLQEYKFYEKDDNGNTAKSVAVQLYSLDDISFAKDYFNCAEDAGSNPDNVNEAYVRRIEYYRDKFSLKNSSFVFCVLDTLDNKVFDSLTESGSSKTFEDFSESAIYKGSSDFYRFYSNGNTVPLRIVYAILTGDDAEANDKYSNAFRWIEIANSLKYFLFVVMFIAALIIVIILSVMTINAGFTDDENGEIVPGFIDKIPLDVCTLFLLSLFTVAWMVIGLTSAADVDMVLNNVVVMFVCVAAILVLMTYLQTLSVRVKMGKIYKNTLFYGIYRKFKRRAPRKFRRFFSDMSMFKKLMLGVSTFVLGEAAILSVMAYLGILRDDGDASTVMLTFIIVWAMTRLLLIPILAMYAINLHYVKEEGQRLAKGVLGDEISDKLTIASIRAHGKNLDLIKKEINKAMEQELKSEKLKSELITNVSHDIKTPLTSIKNYVDLLSRDNLNEEERHKYLEIVNRHTDKLSMLLSDLIEASQISSGNIEINLEKTSLNIVIEQTVEEFATKFEKSELIPRIKMPEDDVCIMGDGKWLWRIFANLFNNACKYAAPGTDVEISVDSKDGKAAVSITNIANTELEIEGDELFERFVRGDSSRHTEGHGLGLSIAKSLTELQQGQLDISVSDNKFTAVLIFDAVQ